MKHFGIAFGTIIAVAVGGAFVLDRVTSSPNHTAPKPIATAKPAQPATPSAEASIGASSVATLDESRLQRVKPGKSTTAPKVAAVAPPTSRSSRQASTTKTLPAPLEAR